MPASAVPHLHVSGHAARGVWIATLLFVVGMLSGGSSVVAAPCWRPPVTAPVSDPFRQPACTWCPGNRGLEYATEFGDEISSVAAGTVTFAGSIAAVRYVVVAVAGGWRITYGNLSESRVAVGESVVAGLTLGTAAGAFHFGVRDGDEYLDPAPYLGEWQFRVRLVPTDGTGAAPSPPPMLRCKTGPPRQRGAPARELALRR